MDEQRRIHGLSLDEQWVRGQVVEKAAREIVDNIFTPLCANRCVNSCPKQGERG